ncbi:MAG: TRAP transporter permease [Beijerinckiaceae bacterium]
MTEMQDAGVNPVRADRPPETAAAVPDLRQRANLLAAVLAFGMVLFGLANIMPAIWILPRLGPFQAEPFRAGMMALALTICYLRFSFGLEWLRQSPTKAAAGFALDGVLLGIALFACWRFYVDGMEMADSVMFFEPFHAWTALGACIGILVLSWRIWGAPLATVAIVTLVYFYTGHHWPWVFEAAKTNFIEGTAGDLWFALDDGVMGNIMSIILLTVFPFIIMGAMMEGSGAGGSLIKISFQAMRRFRGGPAHAAILASGLFGTVSGSAVANVVGTGVITIPMIKKRGFAPSFAGGVEATASTGGQIMPPIMGAAALVMADFIGVSYLTVCAAALTPALLYYASLFASVVFESRRLGVEAKEESDEGMAVAFQDYFNLLLVAVPLAIIIGALIYGLSPAGSALLAIAVLLPMSFLNPEVRRAPFKLVRALAQGGVTFAQLMMAAGTVSIIVAVFSATGLPTKLALVFGAASEQYLFVTLVMAAVACLMLGMGMPTLPAYLTIIVILGPALEKFGLTTLSAHMFVFYFGVASAITPPVAIAAYAAAAIAGSKPIETAVAAVRIGIVIFAIPFAFVYNPELLIVKEAIDAKNFSWGIYAFAVIRTLLAVYLFASAGSWFDRVRLTTPEIVLRFAIGVGLLATHPVAEWIATACALAVIGYHHLRTQGRVQTVEVR